MWALYDWVKSHEKRLWREKFGSEFTGEHEGHRVELAWGERVVGHICRGYPWLDGHLKCMQLTEMRWVFRRLK